MPRAFKYLSILLLNIIIYIHSCRSLRKCIGYFILFSFNTSNDNLVFYTLSACIVANQPFNPVRRYLKNFGWSPPTLLVPNSSIYAAVLSIVMDAVRRLRAAAFSCILSGIIRPSIGYPCPYTTCSVAHRLSLCGQSRCFACRTTQWGTGAKSGPFTVTLSAIHGGAARVAPTGRAPSDKPLCRPDIRHPLPAPRPLYFPIRPNPTTPHSLTV